MGALTDTVELERRTWLSQYVIDDRIISAALDVARDPENTVAARVYALRTLIWQKAPGHLLTVAEIAERAPARNEPRWYSTYANHYYTDRGYGTGEHPWPVLGQVPEEGYVDRMSRAIADMDLHPTDGRVANARAWFNWWKQDAELVELLKKARGNGQVAERPISEMHRRLACPGERT